MATLLDGVNELFDRANLNSGDQPALTSLTDGARQQWINVAVQVWNEVVEELYTTTNQPMPNELAEDTITLVQGQRTYTVATDLVQFRFPLLDETNHHYIFEFPGGYTNLVNLQSNPSDFVGLPSFAAYDPRSGGLFTEYAPDAASAGRIYKYRYDKQISLALATDTFPFRDNVFRALVPAATQVWFRDQRNDFDAGIFQASIGRASRVLSQVIPRDNYLNR